MLTAEQIEDFEARAAAGEKPAHPGWVEIPDTPYLAKLESRLFRVVVSQRGDEWIILGYAQNGLEDCPFASLPAAQLAAEHLLMEHTRDLHRAAYEEIAPSEEL